MKPLALTFLVLAATLCLPLPAAEVVAEPFPPARFTALYLENDAKGTATVIEMAGDAIIYQVTVGNKVQESLTVHPSADDWFKFIQGLNAAKVYKWAPRYDYPGQGNTWVIDLAMDDRKFTSGGTNDYPKNGAETEPAADPKAGPSIPFEIFWQAALALVGKATPSAPVK